MFLFTVTKPGLRQAGALALCAVCLAGTVTAAVRLAGKSVAASATVQTTIENTQDIGTYFTGYGFEVDLSTAAVDKVKIPKKWDDSFTAFNQVVGESGLTLADYKGKTVEKWTVLCPARSDGATDTYCVLLVYKAKPVGAYLLEKPSGEVSGLITAAQTAAEAEQQGYERVSKNPKSTRYGRQNPICAEWNSEEQVLRWRKAWEGVTNKALEQNSIDARVDCRSFKECGIDEQPTIHEGVSAHIIEQRGGVSERCEMNRQIKADNALLLEIKKQIKKLSAIVVDKVKKTVLDFANTLENLRNRYIFNRYEITQNENISTELKQYNTTIDVTVQRYNGIVQQLDNKITELKKMKAEQKHLNPIHIFRHKELTEHIDKTEKEIKKLQNLKSAFLDKMSCKSEKDIPQYKALHIKNDDIIIEIAANNTELEKQCADDKAEFISIKKSIPSEDMVAVQAERYTIHDEYTKSNIQKLQEKYGRKYSYDIYKDVEADVNMELHEKPFSILMRLEKNKQRNTDHNHTKYRNHEQER